MKLVRLCYIGFILGRYRIDELVLTTPWFYPFRFLRLFNPFSYFPYKRLTRGQRIRLAMEKLGPIFIKFGQMLSTRHDLLPKDIADELQKLQDSLPPFSGIKAKRLIEASLNKPLKTLFGHFDYQALACASIAQVHHATLLDGRHVVIKVLRPNIEKQIRRDISLLKMAAHFMQKVLPNGRHIGPVAIIKEFERALHCEIDFTQEAANASQLRHYFASSSLLYIPTIYHHISSKQVLVLEHIKGIAIAKHTILKQQGINLNALSENLITAFFIQVFHHNFFHADLHPGNIFVNANHPDNPGLILVDFGIIGSLSYHDQRYLAENLLAFFNRDYQRVAKLHAKCGWLPQEESIDTFARAIGVVCEPIVAKSLEQISMGNLLLQLFQLARRFHINIQPQLILLQKNLLHIEAISRGLNPHLDPWQTAKPLLEKWMHQQIGLKATWQRIYHKLPLWLEKLPEVPDLIYHHLEKSSSPPPPIMKSQRRYQYLAIATNVFFAASAINFAIMPSLSTLAWILLTIGVVLMLLLFIG